MEYFVKRYVEKAGLATAEEISKETLSQTISHIANPQIQSLAKTLTWLGNDQTHIEQKHPEYNISDIKRFIHGLCYFIRMDQLAKEATTFIEED